MQSLSITSCGPGVVCPVTTSRCSEWCSYKIWQVSKRVERVGHRGAAWLRNFVTNKVSTDSCLVHGGFGRAYLSIREQLLTERAALCQDIQPTSVLVTI